MIDENDANDFSRRIVQSVLDALDDAVRLRDFTRYAPFFHLPVQLETFDGSTQITDQAKLRVMFDSLCGRLDEINVDTLTRNCSLASAHGKGMISGLMETRLIDRSNVVRQTFDGLVALQEVQGRWLVIAAQFATTDADLPAQFVQTEARKSA